MDEKNLKQKQKIKKQPWVKLGIFWVCFRDEKREKPTPKNQKTNHQKLGSQGWQLDKNTSKKYMTEFMTKKTIARKLHEHYTNTIHEYEINQFLLR